MKRPLAIDFDGTLADTGRVKSQYLRSKFGIELEPALCIGQNYRTQIGDEAYREMSSVVYNEASTLSTALIPGAAEAVKTLARERTLFVLTARDKERARPITKWLAEVGLAEAFEEVLFLSEGRSKAQVCDEISAAALIDDNAVHLQPGAKERELILFGKKAPAERPELNSALNWQEASVLLLSAL